MEKKYDIYITYPEELLLLDEKIAETIQSTADNLKISLEKILNRELKIVSKGRDFVSSDAVKYMQASDLAIIIIHPKFVADNEFQAELDEICKQFGLMVNGKAVNSNRVFKICLEPLKEALNPPCIEELLSHDFFEKNLYNRRTTSLSFDLDNISTPIYSKLLDLAYEAATVLQVANNSLPDNDKRGQYIYLGLTTFDQQKAHDELRRELLHYGYQVLPSSKMPLTKEEFEKSLQSCLEKSSIVIQLMGAQYGDLLKGTKFSVIDYQNKMIREYQQNNSENPFRRFIWIPQNNKISDQRQALYLKRMRRDDATTNTEIIECPLETFKTILSSKLEDTNNNPKAVYDNISRVYILSEEDSASEVEELYSALSLSGLKVGMLDYKEQIGIYARHLQLLRDSDAIIIYYKGENAFWLNSKLRDLVKAPGLGRDKPFKKVLVATNILPDAQLIRMIKTKVEVINGKTFEPELLLQKLISE